jgi:hypothetical protein
VPIATVNFLISLHDCEKDNEEGFLVRAADLIGQLGDPHYLRKVNALYYEFEEVGMNRQLGYTSPADLTNQISTVLLEQCFRAYSARSPVSQRYVERTAMDGDPLY